MILNIISYLKPFAFILLIICTILSAIDKEWQIGTFFLLALIYMRLNEMSVEINITNTDKNIKVQHD
jgi:hypothetical protein